MKNSIADIALVITTILTVVLTPVTTIITTNPIYAETGKGTDDNIWS